NGRSGSCPSDVPLPFSMATQYFKYDSICQMMDALRPLVLFAAAFFCVMMIYRGIVEQT
ncbi:MAG: virulence factor TspB C-terminal domain-related protein, partial [Pseudomonadales bacterium]